ncbi:MAG: hypothetical protein IKV87_02980 [Methanobrevibacter sp.]|nr:hypothetical protein [Methanobrevibacter sp.]
MRLKFFNVLLILFIVSIIAVSAVSALEFVDDYNLTSTSFTKDGNIYSNGFRMDVPLNSNFTLVNDGYGEVKNENGKGYLAIFGNYGEFSNDVVMMCFVEDENENGTIVEEVFANVEQSYKVIGEEDGMCILQLNDNQTIYYDDAESDEDSNGTDLNLTNDSSKDLDSNATCLANEDSDDNESIMCNFNSISSSVNRDLDSENGSDDKNISSEDTNLTSDLSSAQSSESYAEPELESPQYAIAFTNEEGSQGFVLLGNNLDLMKEMCESFYFEG